MVIVESQETIQKLISNINQTDFILMTVLCDTNSHPTYNNIALLYFYFLQYDEEYLISFKHNDCIIMNDYDNVINEIINSKTNKYIIDKREMQHIFKNELNDSWKDVSLLEYINIGRLSTNFFDYSPAHKFIYRKFYSYNDLNLSIPVTKHIEFLTDNRVKILKILDRNKTDKEIESFNLMNRLLINNLYRIESSGLKVNNTFNRKDLIYNDLVYLKYKIFTTTGRPSCSFNGYNFVAINKEDGSRKHFVSRFKDGYIVVVDYNAYHFYLISQLIEEKLNVHPYNYIGKVIFDKLELTQEEYSQVKQLAFTIIYGGVPIELRKIPFFNKIHKFSENLFDEYNRNGFIETKLFKRKLYTSESEIKASKLFNYYLQSFETENNMFILDNIFSNVKNFNSKIMLYIYDSIMIDFDINDGAEFINKIINIMEDSGKFPISLQYGKDYHNLVKFERNLYL